MHLIFCHFDFLPTMYQYTVSCKKGTPLVSVDEGYHFLPITFIYVFILMNILIMIFNEYIYFHYYDRIIAIELISLRRIFNFIIVRSILIPLVHSFLLLFLLLFHFLYLSYYIHLYMSFASTSTSTLISTWTSISSSTSISN